MHSVTDKSQIDMQETGARTAGGSPRKWLQALTVGLALVMSACGSGKSDSEINRVSKPNLNEQDIRKYLDTYKELKEHKQIALRAGNPALSTADLNDAIILRHGITVDEFTFLGARIDNSLALLDREQTTPIPQVYKADCGLVRRMRKEIEEVRKPIPFP